MEEEAPTEAQDMCARPGCDLKAKVTIGGYHLCNLCKVEVMDAVDEVVSAGRQRVFTRAKWGRRWPLVSALIRRVGYANSQLLQEHYGMTPEQARDYLHGKKKRGLLEYDRAEGKFFLVQPASHMVFPVGKAIDFVDIEEGAPPVLKPSVEWGCWALTRREQLGMKRPHRCQMRARNSCLTCRAHRKHEVEARTLKARLEAEEPVKETA